MQPSVLSVCLTVTLLTVTWGASLPTRQRRSLPGTSWSDWTPCTAQCGQGIQGRHNCGSGYQMPDLTYPNLVPPPSNPNCVHYMSACNLQPCDDKYDWQEFEPCNKPCGGGERKRLTGPGCSRGRVPVCPAGRRFKQTITCHAQSCDKLPSCGKADIMFVLDSSGSVGDYNWFIEKQFAIDVTKALDIGNDNTRVGMVTYSTEVELTFDFEEHDTMDDLEQAIWRTPWMAGTTNTADAIRKARQVFQNAREDAKKIMVVVTDGNSNILDESTIPQAQEAKQEGITIFVIGIGLGGAINIEELEGIGSTPPDKYVYHVKDFDSLSLITQAIAEGACDAAEDECSKCLYSRGAIDFLPVEGDPCSYYTCTRTPADGGGYRYKKKLMPCGPGTRWDQSILTCNHDLQRVCEDGQPTVPTTTAANNAPPCYMKAVPGNDKVYRNEEANNVTMPCAPGTVFRQINCSCIAGNNEAPVVSTCDGPLLYFPFDDHMNSVGCEKVSAYQVGRTHVTLAWDAKINKSAAFDGQGVLGVSLLANFFAERNLQGFTVALWFKWIGATSKIGGLVNNGDCDEDHSFELHVGDTGSVAGGSLVTDGVGQRATGAYMVRRWEWTHIAEVYNGITLKLYINRKEVSSVPMTGPISNRHCQMLIGQLGRTEGAGLFKGYMDELRLYTRALDAAEIEKLPR